MEAWHGQREREQRHGAKNARAGRAVGRQGAEGSPPLGSGKAAPEDHAEVTPCLRLGDRFVGPEHPCYVIAELGQNHNGDVQQAILMLRAAKQSGADAVKFQKRTPALCVPADQQSIPRDTPWGVMSYLEYRERLELSEKDYDLIDKAARLLGIAWFASVWDEPSVEFMAKYRPPALKIPSACLTDHDLLRACRKTGRPVILSTGMSTMEEIDAAVRVLGRDRLAVLHCTSTYPAQPAELNLRVIETLRQRYGDVVIGYSGHELGLSTTGCAVVLGASIVERHFTLNRADFGTDQAASLEPKGFATLVRDIRKWEAAQGDGIKRVYDSERASMVRLRRVPSREG
jgi:N-acetylneuraminate synthase